MIRSSSTDGHFIDELSLEIFQKTVSILK